MHIVLPKHSVKCCRPRWMTAYYLSVSHVFRQIITVLIKRKENSNYSHGFKANDELHFGQSMFYAVAFFVFRFVCRIGSFTFSQCIFKNETYIIRNTHIQIIYVSVAEFFFRCCCVLSFSNQIPKQLNA